MFFVPVIHPAATFRQPTAIGPLSAHVENFLHLVLNGPPPRPKLEKNPSWKRLSELLRIAKKHRLAIAVDVETGRYGHMAAFAELKIIGIGIDYKAGWGMSWDYSKMPSATRLLLLRAFADPKTVKVLMNGFGYDTVVLQRYGFKIR